MSDMPPLPPEHHPPLPQEPPTEPPPPVTPPPGAAPPTPPARRQLKAWQWVLIGLGVGVVLIIGIIGIVAATARPPSPTSQQATAPQPTATPKPTANPNASAPSYIAAIKPQVADMTAALNQVSTACSSSGDAASCRAAIQSTHDTAVSFQNTLDQHPAPPCLRVVDTHLRNALTDYHDGATLAIQGIDANDASTIQAGADLFTAAGHHVQEASTALGQAIC